MVVYFRFKAKYRYPQTFGAIDGTHIAIKPPRIGLADYTNRKGYQSLILQAVSDDSYVFRDIFVKLPGSCHDSFVYRSSPLFSRLINSMPRRDLEVDGGVIPLHLIGDPAYPLANNLMKPFTGRNLTPSQESFNTYHSSARMVVENAFGRLKARWRMVSRKVDVDVSVMPHLITTACCMHNLCESYKTAVPFNTNNAESNVSFPQPHTYHINNAEATANSIRTLITNYLASTEILRRPHHLQQ